MKINAKDYTDYLMKYQRENPNFMHTRIIEDVRSMLKEIGYTHIVFKKESNGASWEVRQEL